MSFGQYHYIYLPNEFQKMKEKILVPEIDVVSDCFSLESANL